MNAGGKTELDAIEDTANECGNISDGIDWVRVNFLCLKSDRKQTQYGINQQNGEIMIIIAILKTTKQTNTFQCGAQRKINAVKKSVFLYPNI